MRLLVKPSRPRSSVLIRSGHEHFTLSLTELFEHSRAFYGDGD